MLSRTYAARPFARLQKSTGSVATIMRAAPIRPVPIRVLNAAVTTAMVDARGTAIEHHLQSGDVDRDRRSALMSNAPLSRCQCSDVVNGTAVKAGSGVTTAGTNAGNVCVVWRALRRQVSNLRSVRLCRRDSRSRHSENQRLLKDPRPIIGIPTLLAHRAGDRLEATHLAIGLRSIIKPSDKTTLQIRIRTVGDQPAAKKVRSG